MDKGPGGMELEGVYFNGVVRDGLSNEMTFKQKSTEMRNECALQKLLRTHPEVSCCTHIQLQVLHSCPCAPHPSFLPSALLDALATSPVFTRSQLVPLTFLTA